MVVNGVAVQLVMDAKIIAHQIATGHVLAVVIGHVLALAKTPVWENVGLLVWEMHTINKYIS